MEQSQQEIVGKAKQAAKMAIDSERPEFFILCMEEALQKAKCDLGVNPFYRNIHVKERSFAK